jgi:hypothetical protein
MGDSAQKWKKAKIFSWPEGLQLVFVGKKLGFDQQSLPKLSLFPGYFSFCVVFFLGFLQMPDFSQCEEEVRERTFMSCFQYRRGGGDIPWGLGWECHQGSK